MCDSRCCCQVFERHEPTCSVTVSVCILQSMMKERSVPLGTHIYASLISACAIGESGSPGKRLQRAQRLHSQMLGALLLLVHCVLVYPHRSLCSA